MHARFNGVAWGLAGYTAVVVVGLTTVVASVLAGNSRPSVSKAAAGCPAICFPCQLPPVTDWAALSAGPFQGDYDHVHQDCNMSSCGGCTGELAQLWNWSSAAPNLGDVVANGDAASVLSRMPEFPDRILYNSVRQAVQVIGCGGQIIAHYPLPISDANAVLSEAEMSIDGVGNSFTVAFAR